MKGDYMKKIFAIPTINGKLCTHFGRCENFAIIETEDNKIINKIFVNPPVHEPGSFPRFLASQGVSTIISGGMGMNAQQLFLHNNIEVCMGVNSDSPTKLVEDYLNKNLSTGDNLCDGGEHGKGGHHGMHQQN
jgi:predicted Fe-Mo cluster-binding NifX family protein